MSPRKYASRSGGDLVPLNELVSRQMQRMPRRDTKPERLLRRELHRRGLRFRLHVAPLPGKPDIVFTRARLAVFVDGCFWHACPEHGVLPKNNREWWRTKLEGNTERDRQKDRALMDLGWKSVHVWEHTEILIAADVVEGMWRERLAQLRGESTHQR